MTHREQTTTAARSDGVALACLGQVNGRQGTGKSVLAGHVALHAVVGGCRLRVVGDSDLELAVERMWAKWGRHRDLGLPPRTLYLDEAQSTFEYHVGERGQW